MNCSEHQDVAAVATCRKCGAGVCSDCESNTEYTIDDSPFCRSCNYTLITEALADDKSSKGWALFRIVLISICIGMGTLAYLSTSPRDISILIFICGFGGFFSAWKMTSPSRGDRIRNSIDDAVSGHQVVGGGILSWFIRIILRIVFCFILGAISSPILLIIAIVKFNKLKKSIEESEFLLERIAKATPLAL